MNKAAWTLAWLAFTFVALVPAVSAQDKDLALLDEYARLSGRVDKAKAAFRRDDLEKCEREARICLENLPEHHEAHLLMSQVLYKRGGFEAALDHILAAEAGYLKLTEAVALARLRKMNARADNVAGLIDEVDEAMAAELAAKSRGSCQVPAYTKIVQDAKTELIEEQGWGETDNGGEVSRVPAVYSYARGNALFRLGRIEEAEAAYRLAIDGDPRHAEAYNNLINILYSQHRLDEARAFLSQAEAHKAKVHPGLKKAVLGSAAK